MDTMKELGIEQHTANVLECRRLSYFGHVTRMTNDRFHRLLLRGYMHGSRTKGKPKKKWIDNVREDLAARNMSLHQATEPIHH